MFFNPFDLWISRINVIYENPFKKNYQSIYPILNNPVIGNLFSGDYLEQGGFFTKFALSP